jgi:hypothetical protein
MLYEIMTSIHDAIAPQQMRFVLVKGVVDISAADVTKADSPAFHVASGMMMDLKKSGLWFDCNTGLEEEKIWKREVNLLMLLKKDWTEQQRNIYAQYIQTGTQEAVARKMKISQQSVSKALKSIAAAQVQLIEREMNEWTRTGLGKK